MLKKIPKLLIASGIFLLLGIFSMFMYSISNAGECIPIPNTNSCELQDNLWLPLSPISFIIAAFLSLIFLIKQFFFKK